MNYEKGDRLLMLGFVVPLKSAKVSKSWEQVSQLFERTAR